jgi:hypothetical protein
MGKLYAGSGPGETAETAAASRSLCGFLALVLVVFLQQQSFVLGRLGGVGQSLAEHFGVGAIEKRSGDAH